MTVNFKLANVVLRVDDHAVNHPELYYRANMINGTAFDSATETLITAAKTDFLTYLNACSIRKWRRYANIERVWLHAQVAGKGELEITGAQTGPDLDIEGVMEANKLHREGLPTGFANVVSVATQPIDSENLTAIDIEIDGEGLDLIGFALKPAEGETLAIRGAWWYAQVEESAINPVRLALATTTFKKEKYITANIDLVSEGIAKEGAPILGNFHMFVVDNGQTLDAEALTKGFVSVLPNPNAGGSGGFARGMMAATEHPGEFTHVLVMDDDVRILPESLIRTFNLLSLAQGAYKNAFLNGAMLSLEDPVRHFEDVSYVAPSGVYCRLKNNLSIDKLDDIVESERTIVEVDQAYGAWWYSCIPVSAIEKNGLPLPFFIRCDDVEFGVRNNPVYMCMSGICVWHESFEGRFRASVDCYQYTRNFLIMTALHGCANETACVLRTIRNTRQFLRDLDYPAAEMLLDGLEDYLRGPEFLKQLNGSRAMMENGKRNERVRPLEDLDPSVLRAAGVTPAVLKNVDPEGQYPGALTQYVRTLPYDKNYLPQALLNKKPGYVVKNGPVTLENAAIGCETIVYIDPTRTQGAIRHIDQDRFHAIRKREIQLLARWNREHESIAAAWRAAFPTLTSREFWTWYLGLDESKRAESPYYREQ